MSSNHSKIGDVSPANGIDTKRPDKLTRQQLRELEAKEKTRGQKILDLIIVLLPIVCGIVAVCEYLFIPDNSPNDNPNTYLGVLCVFITAYVLYNIYAIIKNTRGDKNVYEKIRYKAPLYSALFLV